MSQYEVTFTAKDKATGRASQYLTNVKETVPANDAAQAAKLIRQRYGADTVVYRTRPIG